VAETASPRAVCLVLAALVPLVLYWHTTGFGFLLDDFVLFQKSVSLDDLGSIPRGFASDVGAVRKGSEVVLGSYYRPVFLALSTLYHAVAGGEPFAWHLAAVGLAAAVGALAFALFLRLGFPPLLALLGSLAFSLHPAHVSSVAWASGLQELLAALFVLTAVLALLARPGGDDGLPLALASVAYALALLSKEVAVGLLPLVVVWAWMRRGRDPAEARRFGRAALSFGVLSAAYLLVRVLVFGALAKPWPRAPGLAASLPSVPFALASYLRLLLWPVDFSIFRPERPVWRLGDPTVVVSLLVLAALATLGWVGARRHRELLLPLAWLVVWLLPVLNFWALDPQWMVTDRYLFLPSLALPWALLVVVPRRFVAGLLGGLVVVYAALTLRYAAIFTDERTFVAAMERAEPTSAVIQAEKGRLLLRDGKRTAAEAALRRAVELDPREPRTLRSLGDLELARRDFAAAEAHYRRALESEPFASKPFKQLALALAQSGRRGEAAALVEESARRWPDDFEVQLLQALFFADRGARQRAEAAFERARRLRPDDPSLAGGLDGAFSRLAPMLLPVGPQG
jgi:tetratricopeptide (TPR) repeat protein